MCIECAVGTDSEKKESSLWGKVKKVRRFLDDALKKTQQDVMTLDSDANLGYLDMTSCAQRSRSGSMTSSVELLACLPLFLLGASNPQLQLLPPPNEKDVSSHKAVHILDHVSYNPPPRKLSQGDKKQISNTIMPISFELKFWFNEIFHDDVILYFTLSASSKLLIRIFGGENLR